MNDFVPEASIVSWSIVLPGLSFPASSLLLMFISVTHSSFSPLWNFYSISFSKVLDSHQPELTSGQKQNASGIAWALGSSFFCRELCTSNLVLPPCTRHVSKWVLCPPWLPTNSQGTQRTFSPNTAPEDNWTTAGQHLIAQEEENNIIVKYSAKLNLLNKIHLGKEPKKTITHSFCWFV